MAEVLPEWEVMQVCRACWTKPVLLQRLSSLGHIAKESQNSCEALTFHNNAKPRKYEAQSHCGWEGILFNIWRSTCSHSGRPMSSENLSHRGSPVWGHQTVLLLLFGGKPSLRKGGVWDKGQVTAPGERRADTESIIFCYLQKKRGKIWFFIEVIYRWFASMQQCGKKMDTDEYPSSLLRGRSLWHSMWAAP